MFKLDIELLENEFDCKLIDKYTINLYHEYIFDKFNIIFCDGIGAKYSEFKTKISNKLIEYTFDYYLSNHETIAFLRTIL